MENNNYNPNNQNNQQPQYNQAPNQQYYQQPQYNQQNYQQPQYNQAPNQQYYQQPQYGMPAYVPQRSIVTCIILTIVTCGIYGIYWMYTLTEDLNAISRDPSAQSGGMVILLSLVTCGIYSLIWLYKQGDTIDRIKTARGIYSTNTGLIYLVLSLFGVGIVSYALMQDSINKLN